MNPIQCPAPTVPCRTDLASAYRAREVSPVEVTQLMLDRIAQHNPRLHCYLTPTPEIALAQARQAEQEMARGQWRGPLHGVPIGLKDLCNTAGVKRLLNELRFF